jgi:hypothetical protein
MERYARRIAASFDKSRRVRPRRITIRSSCGS